MELLDAIVEFGWLQWLAVIFNILYVVYAALRKRICWIFGAIGSTLSFIIYLDVRLFSDASLMVFYLVMSIYGFLAWNKQSVETTLVVRSSSVQHHLIYLLIGLVLTMVLGKFWTMFGAALPYIDAATTSFSLVATYLVAQRYIENWIYWIVIDSVCVWVYIERDLPLIAFLFAAYTVLAVWGWIKWRRIETI